MRVESVFISDIKVGERRREEFGDIEGLAESIGKYQLFHPIIVDGDYNLIAGERRLRACRDVLGWQEIPCRLYEDLSEGERRDIELEENTRRKDLTPLEASKQIVQKAAKTAPFLSSPTEDKKPRGQKRQYEAPKKDVAQALGISVGALVNSEQHVEAVTNYPELSLAPTQKSAIEAAKKLDRMPAAERDKTLARIASEGGRAVVDITRKTPKKSGAKPKPASAKHAAELSQIQVFVQTWLSCGAEDLTAGWTDKEIGDFLADVRECQRGFNALASDLESRVRELQRQAS